MRPEHGSIALCLTHFALAKITCDAGHGIRPQRSDCALYIAMNVSAKDAADLFMLGELSTQGFDLCPSLELERVRYRVGQKRRMVQEQDCGPGRVRRQHAFNVC